MLVVGPVIGPMVIAGVAMTQEKLKQLRSMGVKDSKLLSPRSRVLLAKQIKEVVSNSAYVDVGPVEIDEVVHKGRKLERLNLLEAKCMARVIIQLKPDVAYVDASDVIPERYGKTISEMIPFKVNVISEHHADRNHPVVSAASIHLKLELYIALGAFSEFEGCPTATPAASTLVALVAVEIVPVTVLVNVAGPDTLRVPTVVTPLVTFNPL
jgi:ribonuclease HII